MKKGQLAFEFLTTYGWAVLMVVAVIIIMFLFGVADAQTLKPVRCTLPADSGLSCHDPHASVDGTLSFELTSNGEHLLKDAFCTVHGASTITTKSVRVDNDAPNALTRGVHTVSCLFDGDNPFSGHAGEKRDVAASFVIDGRPISAQIRVKVA